MICIFRSHSTVSAKARNQTQVSLSVPAPRLFKSCTLSHLWTNESRDSLIVGALLLLPERKKSKLMALREN